MVELMVMMEESPVTSNPQKKSDMKKTQSMGLASVTIKVRILPPR